MDESDAGWRVLASGDRSMSVRRIPVWLILLLALASACGRTSPESESGTPGSAVENHRDEPEHPQLPSVIRLTPQVLGNAGVRTVVAREQQLPATIDLSGEIAPDPDRVARVTARAQGRIVEVHFKEGDWVAAGTTIVVVESAELARARAALTSAQARASALRQNARRVTSLGEKRLASAQEVATAEAEAQAAEAEASAARQTLSSYGPGAFQFSENAARLELKAPLAGFVLRRDAVVGQAVAPDSEIAELADLNRAYFMGSALRERSGFSSSWRGCRGSAECLSASDPAGSSRHDRTRAGSGSAHGHRQDSDSRTIGNSEGRIVWHRASISLESSG